jgi:hypothetical protein
METRKRGERGGEGRRGNREVGTTHFTNKDIYI